MQSSYKILNFANFQFSTFMYIVGKNNKGKIIDNSIVLMKMT